MEGFSPLASGSKGNAIYLGYKNTKVLIDCGISTKALQERLFEIGVDIEEIDAILISHEHGDHIGGLKVAMKYEIPVFANSETAKGVYAALREMPRFKIFTTDERFVFQDLEILPFSIQHDTLDPVAFAIAMDDLKVGICTDLGFVTPLVRRALAACDILFVEANHEPSMVQASARPKIYKDRVLSRSGHLSNEACASLLESIVHPELRKIYLAHLSEECNSPETALKRVLDKIGTTFPLEIAPQYKRAEAELFS